MLRNRYTASAFLVGCMTTVAWSVILSAALVGAAMEPTAARADAVAPQVSVQRAIHDGNLLVATPEAHLKRIYLGQYEGPNAKTQAWFLEYVGACPPIGSGHHHCSLKAGMYAVLSASTESWLTFAPATYSHSPAFTGLVRPMKALSIACTHVNSTSTHAVFASAMSLTTARVGSTTRRYKWTIQFSGVAPAGTTGASGTLQIVVDATTGKVLLG